MSGNGNGEEHPLDARSGMLRLQTDLNDKIENAEDLTHLCLTLENGHVQAGTLREEIERRYGPIGLDVLAAAENPSQHYFSQKGFVITYRPEYIECLYASITTANLNTLKAALSWLVMLRRTPVANQISMSWGAWERDVFGLLPLVPADWSRSCWTKMFDTRIVASLLDLGDCEGCDDDYNDDDDFDESEFLYGLSQLLPERPLLKTGPDVMSLLAGVTRPVQVEQGYILCGRYSAIVPVERQADGSVLWHYERKETRGAELQVDDLESLRGEWYQTFDLDLLITASTHIGWSREGEILLGTDQHTHNTTWAPKPKKPEAPYYYSMNLWKIYRYLGFIMDHDYAKKLRNFQNCPRILYDVSTKRVWLVTATNLLLYMVSTFTKTFGTQQFPLPTSSDGVLDFLLNNKNHVIQLSPGKTATLEDLVSGFVANLNKISPISIGRGWIVGHQLMDLIHSTETPAPAIFRLRPRPSWDAVLEGISCLLAADMGDVIVSNRSRATNPPCSRLLTGQNFLAVTVFTINDISYYQGRRILANSGIRKLPGSTWIASDRAFIHCCDHQKDSDEDENCWQKTNLQIHTIHHKVAKSEEKVPSSAAHSGKRRGSLRCEEQSLPLA